MNGTNQPRAAELGTSATGQQTGKPGLDVDLRHVTLRFPGPDRKTYHTIYEDFNLSVPEGSFTILVGPSGCGKSTLLNVIDGLLPVEAERVEVLGKDIREEPEVTRQLAYVFQSPRLLKWKTLRSNVEFALRGLGVKPKNEWNDLIEKYFELAGLSKFLDYYPGMISGGMQQRVSIVRAWVNEPRILLMDEPFSHLDEITAGELRKELIRLWARDDPRRTIIFVTHDLKEAVELGDKVVMLTPTPAEIFHTRDIGLPRPRLDTDSDVVELERQLRIEFARGTSSK